MSGVVPVPSAKDQFDFSPFLGASILGAAGAILAFAVTYEPILILALALAASLAIISLRRPALALKLMLLYGGIPLELLGHSDNPAEKPLFRSLGGTTVDGLVLLTLSLTLTLVLLNSRPVRIPKHLWPYLTFVGFVTLTLFYSTARLDGLRLVLKLTYPVLVFLIALRFLKTPGEVDSTLKYWIAGGIVSTLSGAILYGFRGVEAFVYGGDVRYSSGITYYSVFSMYMFSLFMLCYAIWRTGGNKRYGALALLFGFQTMASQTRITWAAVLVALLLFESTASKGLRRLGRVAGMAALLGLFVFYLFWHLPQVQRRMFGTELEGSLSAPEILEQLNLSSRGFVWTAVYEDYLAHNHWVGQGAGSNMLVLRSNFPLTVAAPHNEYLRLLHDTGIIGLLWFLVAIASLFVFLRSLLRGCVSAQQRLFVRLAPALLTGYAITAITDNPLDYYLLFSQYVFFTMAVAVGAAKWQPTFPRNAPAGQAASPTG